VQNYRKALNYGLERLCSLPISLRLIREIHGKLMEGVRGEYLTPGEFRSSQNWIGPAGSAINSATLVPPPVDEMHTALAELENFIHSASDLPKLVQAGLIQYQFETIHPFLDGNGRLGRLLVTLLLIEWGLISQPLLYLSAFFETHRLEYYDNLLAVSQLGDWERWLRFFLRGVSSQSMDATRRIECLGKLRTCYRELLSNERAGVRLLEALDALFERPILTIHQLESALGVPFISARRYMEKLVEKGIVREITGHTRNRLYQADDILKALMSTQ
jgi:Fic family protein